MVNLAGVVLNQIASDGHETLLREALVPLGVPVLGALRRDDRLAWRDGHLGLVPVAEHPDDVSRSLDALGAAVADRIDLAAVVDVAGSAPTMTVDDVADPDPVAGQPRIAVVAGPAFTFSYTDTLEAFEAAGAEIVAVDPLRDERLPEGIDGLVIGGGFPEVHALELSANERLRTDVAIRVTGGLPTWAECGGLAFLCRSLDSAPMAGVVPAEATMTDRLTLGYRTATTLVDSPLGPAGMTLRSHEFHYSTVAPAGDALELTSRFGHRREGWATPTLLATYLHHHPGGDPRPVGNFVACAQARTG